MINTENIFIIAKKELKGYFDSPVAYIVLVVFLLLWQYLFFRNAFLVGEASLRSLFDLLPWLFLLLIPALTMGSVAQEKSEGMLEVLLTHSVRDEELVVGKFVGSLLFVAAALLFVVPVAYGFSQYGSLDWGEVLGQYLAALSMAAVLASLGIGISTASRSQITALLITVAISFFLIVAGFEFVTASLPLSVAPILEGLSVMSHFTSMARGVIDVRDVWYFASATIIFLGFAYLILLRRRFGNQRRRYRSYQLGVLLAVAIAVVTNVIGARIPGRLDLTQDNRYTLSAETRQTLRQLPDIVNVTLFASGRLPAQLQPILREIKDMLRDYDSLGGNNLVVAVKNPQADPEDAKEAVSLDIQAVQFNVVGQDALSVQGGHLGIAVVYAGQHETIPFVQNASDLEYQLTSRIRQLTTTDKKKVAFVTSYGSKNRFVAMRALTTELEKQFVITDIDLQNSKEAFPAGTDVVVLAGPTQELDQTGREALKKYLDEGGSALLLVDSVTANQQFFTATPLKHNLNELLGQYGITVQTDLVYDLRSHETVRFGSGVIGYLLPYPLWPRVPVSKDARDIVERTEAVLVPWPSSLVIDEKKAQEAGVTIRKVLTTTPFAGQQTQAFTLAPDQKFSQEGLAERTIAAGIEKGSMRLVVVGDSEFLTDQFAGESPENLAFGVSTLSWLTQQESLAGLRLKQAAQRRLLFTHPSQVAIVKYGNFALTALGVPAVGFWRLMRRRARQRLTYLSHA